MDEAPQDAAELIPLVYDELRRIARQHLRQQRPGHTLQATALVNEVYLRLARGANQFNGRSHFCAVAAEAMRRLLLEHARNRGRQKRGGGRKRLPLSAVDQAADADGEQIRDVDDAIARLERRDPELAQVVKLRIFAGFSCAHTAKTLGVSESTVRRDWKIAKAWLARELHERWTG